MAFTVRRFAVTSSPVSPSPRVAPRTKTPSLVTQADRQAIEFGFHREHGTAAAERLFDAPLEVGYLTKALALAFTVLLEGVVERKHGDGVADLGEAPLRPRTHPARGRIGRSQRGMRVFQRLQLAQHPVVLEVRDLRIIEYVVAIVGAFDHLPQLDRAGLPFVGRVLAHADVLIAEV